MKKKNEQKKMQQKKMTKKRINCQLIKSISKNLLKSFGGLCQQREHCIYGNMTLV